ncbi:MAG: Fic family protein [Egibacteraceae bacterium]
MRVRIAYTDHLVDLVARVEAAAARLLGADPALLASVVAVSRRDAARLSARLDGSPLTDETADAVDAGAVPNPLARRESPSTDQAGWAQVLRLAGMPTQDVAAVEYQNLLACFDAEPAIASGFFERPLESLRWLHGLICSGLVDPNIIGQPRQAAQAVHDGAQGRVIYRAVEPAVVPGLLDELASWLGGGHSAMLPTLVVAGIVQERLLEWQPFEAANGRLARAASRVVLRARGLDPHGSCVPERELSADPLGYYGEVAATIRRRGDLGPWLERYGEAVLAAVERVAGAVDPRPRPEPHARALAVAGGLEPGETVTIAEYAARVRTSHDTARADLRTLAQAGVLAVDPLTHGLRYRRR